MTPTSVQVGFGQFSVNSNPANPTLVLMVPERVQFSSDFVCGFPPSDLTYAIPADARMFSAVAYSMAGAMPVQIYVDDILVHQTTQTGLENVVVDLPGGSKTIRTRSPARSGARRLGLLAAAEVLQIENSQ